MLHVGELKTLPLEVLLRLNQLLSFLIQFLLHVVQVGVQHGDRLLQIIDLLVFHEQFSLVSPDVVDKDSLFAFSATLISHRVLQTVQKFILSLVQVLYK